ncbi:uncharacterized protein EI97DRAFT_467927 [Westerdykella ornata]|uniref:Uncharacterized protein n=1 Tax=Westerdykella ornata TaxID=318751 RepID=A0A6A6JHA1_WESOR|nr:uncharacterized protein EI97DRAFT_467927 [Westerdykella ornata]KAF2275338.1 hypothetical protein EI97DRAFT_467927 [Westerdykella ornata]
MAGMRIGRSESSALPETSLDGFPLPPLSHQHFMSPALSIKTAGIKRTRSASTDPPLLEAHGQPNATASQVLPATHQNWTHFSAPLMAGKKRPRSVSPNSPRLGQDKQLRQMTLVGNDGIAEATYFIWQSTGPELKKAYTEALRILKWRVRLLAWVRERLEVLNRDLPDETRVQICHEITSFHRDYQNRQTELQVTIEMISNLLGTDVRLKLGALPKELRAMILKELTKQAEPVSWYSPGAIPLAIYNFQAGVLGKELAVEIVIAYYKSNILLIPDSRQLEAFVRPCWEDRCYLGAAGTINHTDFMNHLIVQIQYSQYEAINRDVASLKSEEIGQSLEHLISLRPQRKFRLELQMHAPTKEKIEELMGAITSQYRELVAGGFIVEVTCAKHGSMWYPRNLTEFFNCSTESWRLVVEEHRKTAPELRLEDIDDATERADIAWLKEEIPTKSFQDIAIALLASHGSRWAALTLLEQTQP